MNNLKFLELAAEIGAEVNPKPVAPNPRVGAIAVQAGKVLATAAHNFFGGNHAEKNLLLELEKMRVSDFSEIEIYVSLEPCEFFTGKKTASCSELLRKMRPKKIVFGSVDPRFGGKNVEKFRAAGIECVFEKSQKCADLNPHFQVFEKFGRPFVRVKMAATLNGKVVLASGEKRISGQCSQRKVHEMRSEFSAILTTTQTIFDDDPRLDLRFLETSSRKKIPDLIVCGRRAGKVEETTQIFAARNRQVHFFPEMEVEKVLEKSAEMGYFSVLTECGPRMATTLLAKNLVDEVAIFWAGKILHGTKSLFGTEILDFAERFELVSAEKIDDDLLALFRKKN